MYLYYDRVAKMFTFETDEGSEFLGPMTQTLSVLRTKYKLTDSQAREATLRAVFNMGDAVDIDNVKRMS